ncbi:MAG: WG repeat-containing protein [Clostridia bacterium]|nr:WG repeat-containing protein [Clostridia bacterium]
MLKIKSILSTLLILMLATLPALSEGFHRVEKDGRFALADDTGFLLTDYIYDDIYCYDTEPPFRVSRDGHAGYIDEAGYEVVPAIYDALDVSFREGVAPARLNDKWGYVDEAGRLVIGPWFDEVDQFSEGLAGVEQNGKWGYIDHTGRFAVEPRFDFGGWFHNGYAQVHLDGKTGLIDKNGAWALEPEFDDADIHMDDDGLISVIYPDAGDSFRYFDISSGTAVEVKSVGSGIDLSDYMPFEGKKVATLSEERTLDKRITEEQTLPRLDGATALFPVYAAFCQAVYPKATRYTRLVDNEVNTEALITCTKTNRAYERLIQGDADIIFVAQPSDEELDMAAEEGVEFDMIPIGREAFVFIVNKDNPLDSITVDQIKGVYSGQITDWSQLGVQGIGPIVAYQRPKNSGSQTALKALMGDTPLREAPKGVVAWDMGDILDTVEYRNLPNAIGYSFRFFCTDMMGSEVKLLAVDGVEPTEANIRNGSYPITSTVYAIRLKGNDNPNVVALLDWIKSPQGMELVEKSGYTPWEG